MCLIVVFIGLQSRNMCQCTAAEREHCGEGCQTGCQAGQQGRCVGELIADQRTVARDTKPPVRAEQRVRACFFVKGSCACDQFKYVSVHSQLVFLG